MAAGLLLGGLLALALRAAGSPAAMLETTGASAAALEPEAPLLPAAPGPFAPSFVAPAGPEPLDADVLSDTEACARCHAGIAGEWRTSAHAWASFGNPWYRAAVDRNREATGFVASRFCGGCHDLALLPGGGMDRAVRPDDPLGHAGVTCTVCHGVRRTSVDGNASLSLTTGPIPYPVPGDAESLARHRARVAPPELRSDALCITCHRGFLGPDTGNPDFLIGMDDATAWQRSSFGGTGVERLDDELPARGCRDCHMPEETDGHRAHYFTGAQTSLAAALGEEEQSARMAALLRSAATIDVAALRHGDGTWNLPADGAPLAPGEVVWLDVVVRNVGTGHRFPGGTLDLQDTWLELEVRDATGRLVAEAGTRYESEGADPTAHVLRAFPIDQEARPELHHVVSNMRTVAWDHTLAPREAGVARWELRVPDPLDPAALPLTATARLRHRRHHAAFREGVCEATRSDRGRAFTAALEALGRTAPDGCAEAPVLDLAEATVALGAGAPGPRDGARPTWRRLYDHALGLVHQLPEHLDEARRSLEVAWDEVAEVGSDREQAMVLVLRAEVEGRLGRVTEALGLLDEAETRLPGHPAIAFRRGEALAAVWRWEEAARAYRDVTEAVPESDVAWQRLAQALTSLGRHAEALEAARHGLAMQPRDASLLLTQALALEALGAPPEESEAARSAFLAHRSPDAAPGLRYRCFREVPECAEQRLPVRVRPMRYPEAGD